LSNSRSFQEKLVAEAKALQAQAQATPGALQADAVRAARATEQAFNEGAALDATEPNFADDMPEASAEVDSVTAFCIQEAQANGDL
jgi:hypothetical protein